MRSIYTSILFIACLLSASGVFAQKKTIILVRHAEKDLSSAANPNDPELSADGRERATRLARRIRGYHVGAVYSSNYRRTRETADPTAKRRKTEVKIYDPAKPQDLIKELMNAPTKRFLIVGHSNTIPPLANLLVKKELFKNLEESEFGTIWVIKLRNGDPPLVKVLSY
jgi:2,3-bisphosphoglycerate-dependent phosphoglycerate mutase